MEKKKNKLVVIEGKRQINLNKEMRDLEGALYERPPNRAETEAGQSKPVPVTLGFLIKNALLTFGEGTPEDKKRRFDLAKRIVKEMKNKDSDSIFTAPEVEEIIECIGKQVTPFELMGVAWDAIEGGKQSGS